MEVFETAVIYLLVGTTVASAMALSGPTRSVPSAVGLFVVRVCTWPFFAPILLARAVDTENPSEAEPGDFDTDSLPEDPRRNSPVDRVQAQLLAALERVGPVAEQLLGPQMESVNNLSRSLRRMQRRVDEMDALLDSPEFDKKSADQALENLLEDPDIDDGDPRIESVRSRRRNIDRLHRMRRRARRDLEKALLKMEEMNSQILLLQFAEKPNDEIAENIQEIASTIDGLSEGLLTV